jgi:hypothetical protein
VSALLPRSPSPSSLLQSPLSQLPGVYLLQPLWNQPHLHNRTQQLHSWTAAPFA